MTHDSAFRITPASAADDAELREVLRRTPMGGRIEVAFLREPNFFLTTDIQGTWSEVFVGRVGDKVVGFGTRSIRPSFINGARVEAGYLADLRLLPEYRGGSFVARGYRQLRESHRDGRAEVYSTVIVEDNETALKSIAAGRAGLPVYAPMGRILTPLLHLRRSKLEISADIVRGSHELLPVIVARLNENDMQFAPAYSEQDFLNGRMHGFAIEDFYVLRRGGRIAGVLGMWNQRSFRQTVVVRYHGALGWLRPWINLLRRPRLPPPREPLKLRYLAFVATDDVDAFRALVRRAYNDALTTGDDYLTVGLHERDPRVAVLEEYERTPFAGRLFVVTFDGAANLDDRIPYIDAALL